MLARTPRVRAAKEGEPARVFRVSVARSGAVFRGKLIVEETGHARKPRLVSGESCGDVVGALALIAALAVDPQALTGPTASPSGAASIASEPTSLDAGAATADSAAPSLPVAEDGSTSADSTALPSPPPPSSPPPAPPASSTSPALPAPRPPRAPWLLSAGATFDLASAGALGAVPGGSVFLDVSRENDGWFRPGVRLGVSHYGETSVVAGQASVRFAWTVGELDLCPVALRGATFSAKPCVSMEAGGLLATPSGPLLNAHDQLNPWISAGALAAFEWRVLRVLALEAHGGLKARPRDAGRGLSAMPFDLRTVFVLFELEELTMAEIADLLGLAPGTIASRLRRAREDYGAAVKRMRLRAARQGVA